MVVCFKHPSVAVAVENLYDEFIVQLIALLFGCKDTKNMLKRNESFLSKIRFST